MKMLTTNVRDSKERGCGCFFSHYEDLGTHWVAVMAFDGIWPGRHARFNRASLETRLANLKKGGLPHDETELALRGLPAPPPEVKP